MPNPQHLKIGDIVYNEYHHVGKLVEINGYDEAGVDVYDFGIEDDTDWCALSKCRKATPVEIAKAKAIGLQCQLNIKNKNNSSCA